MKVSRRGALLGGAGLAATAVAAGYALSSRDNLAPAAPPLIDAQGHRLWRNWSGVQHAYPAVRLAPENEGQLARALSTALAPVRPVGAGRAFTALAPTGGTMVWLEALSGILAWEGDEAVVAGGTRLDALGQALAANGRALIDPPQDGMATLAGVLATGAHGAGARLQALHGDVTALRLVTSRGEVIDCDDRHRAELFQAAKVSLGTLGVVTRVRLRTRADRRLERKVWLEPLEDALAKAETRWIAHRGFQLHAAPFTGLAINASLDETDAPAQCEAGRDAAIGETLEGLRNLLDFAPPLRKAAARTWLSRTEPRRMVSEGWRLLAQEPPMRFNAMAFHLPAEVQLKALVEVIAAVEAARSDVFLPITCGRVAPDEAWLSPFQGQPRGSITVRARDGDDFAFLYTVVEPIFRRHGGRPHWGMLHSLSGGQLAGLYPRWSDFLKIRATLDPDGRMLNPYLKGLFGV